MKNPAYSQLNDAWKSTCRTLFGGEAGELAAFEPYLAQYNEPLRHEKSCLSGKPVTLSYPFFPKSADFISNDEMADFSKKAGREKLLINDIKDIDSLSRSLSETFAYSGNIHTGNCEQIFESDMCADSQFVDHSSEVYGAKFIVYTSQSRLDEYAFGSNCLGEGKSIIRCYYAHKLTRGFESLSNYNTSDIYYCANLESCSNCMFSFNLRSKRNCIGNNVLPQADYKKLRNKLVAEMLSELSAKKRAPSIFDIMVD